MPIKHNGRIKHETCSDEMSVEDFKQWIKKFDANGDGRISKNELREAIRSVGKWFSGWKSGQGIRVADKNHNGVIDDEEISYLIDFAKKTMGIKIVMYQLASFAAYIHVKGLK